MEEITFATTLTTERLNEAEPYLIEVIECQQRNHENRIVRILKLNRRTQILLVILMTSLVSFLSFLLYSLTPPGTSANFWLSLGVLTLLLFFWFCSHGPEKLDGIFHSYTLKMIRFRIRKTFGRTRKKAPLEIQYRLEGSHCQIEIPELKFQKTIPLNKVERAYCSPCFYCLMSSPTTHFWKGIVYYDSEDDSRIVEQFCHQHDIKVLTFDVIKTFE